MILQNISEVSVLNVCQIQELLPTRARNAVGNKSFPYHVGTHLVNFPFHHLAVFHCLDVHIVIRIIWWFSIPSLVFFGQNVSDDEKQDGAHGITNANDLLTNINNMS